MRSHPYYHTLTKHTLLCLGEQTQYQLQSADDADCVIHLAFTPTSIVIEGASLLLKADQTFEWFVQQQKELALCEVFLERRWCVDIALEAVQRRLTDACSDLHEMQERLRDQDDPYGSLYEEDLLRMYQDLSVDLLTSERAWTLEGMDILLSTQYPELTNFISADIGVGFPTIEAGWLSAIQLRFVELLGQSSG